VGQTRAREEEAERVVRITKKHRRRIGRILIIAFLILFVLSITTGLVLLSRAQSQAPAPATTTAP